ncbi:MAG: tRNA (N(6)-L-threonylcarbamoyladenosine(37)-C(2))-methylthiotransferase MtaB [Bacteroidales bacterium]|jgi:threonylcarbamoyladenosine tRNA methylthiotransferase MtaB|nr:tRNA (N(6)-L-threonylcarbamoyladenosine(37)-C(2))-methylthiotransferase MtaB [Bacteroidales bacterium]MDD3701792.1 tRNA (N(6)-L-threonylcarbamoyladenosine(37)-C(2))-methylthiotransferase MtaB [Bacteroidales bacterium]MDY0369762.1 tRNA (N(6)-L-threonylcarbamoyladenosine(37)-C(2))-methylthiotransferase MtaB [Bacteroidales bacterium]
MKIAFKTLGCRLNQYETDALASRFHQGSYELVDFNEQADIYIVNTCTVTNQSDQKSRQTINQARNKNKDAIVVVTGCMANNYKKSLLETNAIDFVVDNERKSQIYSILENHFRGTAADPEGFDKDVFSYEAAYKTFHTRSMIKIQDGCDNFCTFCIIPKVRGRAVSRPAEEIYTNIRQVIDHGFKEVVLTGVNIGRYLDRTTNFERLVENILHLEGDFRLRISSIEPDGFSDRFFDLFEHPKLTPHLHLCLQSGSESVLLRMRRMYTAAQFAAMVNKLKSRFPDFNITTDMIVGFPGETEEEFEQSVQMAQELAFSHIHTFKYSIRTGTRAERMPDQISEKVKNQRSAILRNISTANKKEYYSTMIGKPQRMLIERITSDGTARGYGENYIPLRLKGKNLQKNQFVNVLLTGLHEGKEPEVLAIPATEVK